VAFYATNYISYLTAALVDRKRNNQLSKFSETSGTYKIVNETKRDKERHKII
jgi:hypothetical protein|tara:strand:+ start:1210 stop:1365 length:156 start_codon:yes stop_codon:yes gene_type:complete